jgi:hypothetical protein
MREPAVLTDRSGIPLAMIGVAHDNDDGLAVAPGTVDEGTISVAPSWLCALVKPNGLSFRHERMRVSD